MLDSAIFKRMLDGEKGAIRELFEIYQGKVFYTAKAMLNDEAAAEDVLQEVFITIYRKIYTLKSCEAFDSWLYRLVINCSKNYLRKNVRTILLDEYNREEEVSDISGDQPEDSYLEKEFNKEISQAVSKLNHKLKECIVLYYFNEFSIKEIAKILGCAEGTVKSRLFNAKRVLEKNLQLNNRNEVKEIGYR